MAHFTPAFIQQAQDRLAVNDSWSPVRKSAFASLQKLGLPNPRSNDFFWVPQSILRSLDTAPISQYVETKSESNSLTKSLEIESDFSACMAPLFCAKPEFVAIDSQTKKHVVQNVDFCSYSQIEIAENAVVDLYWNPASKIEAWSFPRLDIKINDNAQVNIIVTPSLGKQLRYASIDLGKNAVVHWLELDVGSDLLRTHLHAHLNGDSASFNFRALSLLTDSAQSHRRIYAHHNAPNVRSSQWNRNILQGQSHASCDSTVEISRNITGTEGHQLINSMLLSPTAKASSKPTLLIHNDEVQASHGSTCGDLDPTQLFYLRSRGLSPDEARRVLLQSFVYALLNEHPSEEQRNSILNTVNATLAERFA